MNSILLIIIGVAGIVFAYFYKPSEEKRQFLFGVQGYVAGTAAILIGIFMLLGRC